MDNLVENRSKKKNKRELCIFYSAITSFETLLHAKQNIRRLTIIGIRNICSFQAITELIQLQELWIVECGIKLAPSFREDCLLRKLYLYSNEIRSIPDLQVCSDLITLNLAGNKISVLENLDKLACLQELNLANNALERIHKFPWKRSNLQYLNLAGNPLCFLRDVRYLSQLQKLNSLVFSDPLYGDCSLVALCNYRVYVIYYLPHIRNLDHYEIGERERQWIIQFFKKQATYYNVLLHNHLSDRLSLLTLKCKEYRTRMLQYKNERYSIEMKKRESSCAADNSFDMLQNINSQVKLNKKHLEETKEIIFIRLQILHQQLLTNLNHCGNISFVEYNINSENTVIQLCKQFLQASLCSAMKVGTGIRQLKLHKVTKVINKELDQLNVCKGKTEQSDECSMILKILACPGVADIQKWPFNISRTDSLIKKNLIVTNCLASADSDWLTKMCWMKDKGNALNNYRLCERLRVCVLVQTPTINSEEKTNNVRDYIHVKYTNCCDDTSESCQIFRLANTIIKTPVFVIEYEYTLPELINVDEPADFTDKDSVDSTMTICLSNSNISQCINATETLNTMNLVQLCISGQNISCIDIDLDLPNLRELDVSFNQLEKFPDSVFMKNVVKLNMCYNNVQILHFGEAFPALKELNISWNLLTNCFESIQSLATFALNINNLKIHNNPFEDIIDPQIVEYTMYMYLPNVEFINSCKLQNFNLSLNYFPCVFNMCKLHHKLHNKLISGRYFALARNEQTKLLEKKNIERERFIHISQDYITAMNMMKAVKNMQELCIACCSLCMFAPTKPMKYLVKLNLGSNFISILNGFTQVNLPVLKYLDLTNNLITSLEAMGSFHTLQEFYCGNNQISLIEHIDNIKSWQRLHIIDLRDNPISSDALYKKFITFHLSNIEYISGNYIEKSDIYEASTIFGNKCDKHVLNIMYETNHLVNITQLSLVECSLAKVDISAELLPQLESLDLSKNKITYLCGLHSFKSLRTLCLSYNCLEAFNGSGCEANKSTFPKLYTLFLDHNCIKSLINITTQKLPVIRHLFLNNNCLQNIDEINHCSTLESLLLDSNKIEALNVDDFIENENLKVLSLENNKIKSLEFTKHLKKLKKLYLAYNCLANEIEMQYILLLKNLEEITLEGNPLYNGNNKDTIIALDFGVKDAEIEKI